MTGQRWSMAGCIASTGFTSGHRFTVGHWDDTPIGPMADVMWARPDGERVLLADRRETADFVSAVYAFDRLEVVPFEVARSARSLDLTAGPLALHLRAAAGWKLPFPRLRTPEVGRWIEGPIARAVLGVRTYGTSPTGVHEWYRADEWRPLLSAWGTFDGEDLGGVAPIDPPLRVGFSEPPKRPSMVLVRPLLEDPRGVLARLFEPARG